MGLIRDTLSKIFGMPRKWDELEITDEGMKEVQESIKQNPKKALWMNIKDIFAEYDETKDKAIAALDLFAVYEIFQKEGLNVIDLINEDRKQEAD
jgi:hypothetical protein